jgi:GT2 family glycosyltransferase
MRYAVCIVTYNSQADIADCLESVHKHTPDAEICVVDNASTDNTKSILSKYEGSVRLIFNDKNEGFAPATNMAIADTTAEYVIMLNPDTIVHPLWADRLAAHMNRPGVGAVGPLSTNCIGYQSVHPTDMSMLEIRERVLREAGQYSKHKLIIGFCLMTRRGIIERIGALDDNMFLGNDDLEFCWRLQCYGYSCVVAHDAFIEHKLGQSFKSNSKSSILVQQSTDALYRKLFRYFNGDVPSSETIWGVPWFKPSKEVIHECQSSRTSL